MNIDRDVVSKLLQDKGFLRFKPFNLNDSNEVYAYYSEEHGKRIFHFCDNKLHDLKRKDIGLQDGVLFILGTSEAYSLMEEYTHVKGHHGQDIDPYHDDGWLIGEDNTILSFSVNGYFKVSEYRYVLESSIIDASKGGLLTTLNKKYEVYDAKRNSIHDSGQYSCSYYGSFNSCHILNDQDNGFFLVNEEGDIVGSHLSYIWISKYTIKLISIEYGDDSCFIIKDFKYDNTVKIRVPVYFDHSFATYFLFYTDDDTLCCLYHYSNYEKQLSTHIFIIAHDTLLYEGSFSNDYQISNLKNGILTARYKKNDTGFHFYYFDYHLVELGKAYSYKEQFVIVKRPYYKVGRTVLAEDFLYGILDTYDMKLVIPIRYDDIKILCNNDPLCVRVGMLKSDEQSLEYGLFLNNKLLLPLYNDNITLLGHFQDNMLIRWERDNMYGLICNDEICLTNIYQSIDIKNGYIIVGNNDKFGFYTPSTKYLSPILFKHISFIRNKLVIADNNIFKIIGDEIKPMTAFNNDLFYKNSVDDYHMFKLRGLTKETIIEDYVCYRLFNDKIEQVSVDFLEPSDVDELNGYTIRDRVYFLVDESLYYDSQDDRFVKKVDIIEEEPYSSYGDDYDYDRDTFYALGGDDYDNWRNNGGNLDDMMDGMGF